MESTFRKLNSREIKANKVYVVNLKGCYFPLYLSKQVFTHENGTETALYITSNDEFLDYRNMKKVYQKRWNIEVYHKSLKQNCSLGKAPVRAIKNIIGHIFSPIYALVILEKAKISLQINQFKMKSNFYLKGLKNIFKFVKNFKTA